MPHYVVLFLFLFFLFFFFLLFFLLLFLFFFLFFFLFYFFFFCAFNSSRDIGGFNQRQGEVLPPQIFLTLKFVVWAKVQNDENYRNCCHLMSDFKVKKTLNSISDGALPQTPLEELAVLPRPPADPIPAPGLETTCLPKYVSLNPPMLRDNTLPQHPILILLLRFFPDHLRLAFLLLQCSSLCSSVISCLDCLEESMLKTVW